MMYELQDYLISRANSISHSIKFNSNKNLIYIVVYSKIQKNIWIPNDMTHNAENSIWFSWLDISMDITKCCT